MVAVETPKVLVSTSCLCGMKLNQACVQKQSYGWDKARWLLALWASRLQKTGWDRVVCLACQTVGSPANAEKAAVDKRPTKRGRRAEDAPPIHLSVSLSLRLCLFLPFPLPRHPILSNPRLGLDRCLRRLAALPSVDCLHTALM